MTISQIKASFSAWISALNETYDVAGDGDRQEISTAVADFSRGLDLLDRVNEGNPDEVSIAEDMYRSSLEQFRTLVDVIAIHGVNDSLGNYTAANAKIIARLKELSQGKPPGFLDGFIQAIKDALTTVGMGFGAVIGGAIVILFVYLYLKGRK